MWSAISQEMGGLFSYLYSWGAPTYDTTPDPATGLSERDRVLITESWKVLAAKKNIKHNAVEFFIQLFAAYPHMQDYFPAFKGKKAEELRRMPKMKAHSMSVMYVIGSFVDNMDDPEAVVGLVQKLAVSHIQRDIRADEFERVEKMFSPFLRSVFGAQSTPEVEEAWGKLLAVQTMLVKKTEEEMDQ